MKQGQAKMTAWDTFHKFLFKNRIFSTVLGFSLFHLWLTTSPALEKILSQGTEEAGVHKKFIASL